MKKQRFLATFSATFLRSFLRFGETQKIWLDYRENPCYNEKRARIRLIAWRRGRRSNKRKDEGNGGIHL
jgi:hypothetical protein